MEVNKEIEVAMLPTGKGDSFPILKNLKIGGGLFTPTPNYYYTKEYLSVEGWKACHLYFSSDEKIKEGNWVYVYNPKASMKPIIGYVISIAEERSGNTFLIVKTLKGEERELSFDISKKIIATTDEKLNKQGIAKPSQAFIRAYVEQDGIDRVLVEYKGIVKHAGGEFKPDKYLPKVNSHNEITIHPIKTNWSKKEVEDMLFDIHTSLCWDDKTPEELIDNCRTLISTYQQKL